MKTIKTCLLFIFLSYCGMTSLWAQKTIASSGGIAAGNEGQISYSIGQLFFGTIESADGSVIQGVQQPFEISVLIGLNEFPDINLHCDIYPNPVADKVMLSVEDETPTDYFAILTDMDGRLLRQISIESTETKIELSHLKPATYFMTVIRKPSTGISLNQHSRQTIKSFKIIKL